MPAFLKAIKAIGGLRDINFNVPDHHTLFLTGHFESDFEELLKELAKDAGNLFDALFRHVQHPPAMPVSVPRPADLRAGSDSTALLYLTRWQEI
ncbi:MAG: hypothetical protein WDM78_14365 [Puia sp.]